MPRKKLFLIDGSAIAYRSYFAFINNPLINSKGQNTSAVFGFLRFLFMIYDNEHPHSIAVVFDPKGKTFRHEQYSEYKATRQKMPDDMRDQIPIIHGVLDALNIPRIEIAGFEADDVIGTLAKQAQVLDYETYLVTGDKDFMQLVDHHIKLYNFKRAGEQPEILDADAVLAKVGLPPEKIVDYLGLMGDTSDNVPGVQGVGEKTAVKLIQEFGSLEETLENADKVSRANVRENLQKQRDQALLSKRLVVIDTEVVHDIDLASLQCAEPNLEQLIPLFKELEFTSLLERFKGAASVDTAPVRYQLVNSKERERSLLAKLRSSKHVAIKVVTTDEHPLAADILGIAFASQSSDAYYWPLTTAAGASQSASQLEMPLDSAEPDAPAMLGSELKTLLEDDKIQKIGHNIKHDMLVLQSHGIDLRGVSFDTMLASYVVNPGFKQHNLEALALEYLNHKKRLWVELLGKGKNKLGMDEVAAENVTPFACEDADMTLRLRERFLPMLKNGDLEKLYETVELPLVSVLKDLEREGVSLDLDFLREMSKQMSIQVENLVTRIYQVAGEEFNINSTQQLGEILFEKLGLPRKKKTKTGYSTDAKVLEDLARDHDLPRILLEYRELTKLKSTYVDALPNLVNPRTGRLHTSYNQTVATTGRLSSSDPNLQNIPIRTELGREIRRAFVPRDDDHVILDADYSQIELRVMAHLSQDPTLIEAFRNGEDIHTKTACLVFGVHPEDLTHEHRRRAKEINFGIMYGMGAFGLASRLQISNDEARAFIDSYFALYHKVGEFIERTHRETEEKGYVTTMLNRRRYLPEIHSKNRNIREFAKRTAVNTPIQGTAADLLKVAMINIWRRLREGGFRAKMIMQVHDELVFEVPKNEVEPVTNLVRNGMENALPLDVPIKADIGAGPNWLDAK